MTSENHLAGTNVIVQVPMLWVAPKIIQSLGPNSVILYTKVDGDIYLDKMFEFDDYVVIHTVFLQSTITWIDIITSQT